MFWYILVVICLILMVVGIVLQKRWEYDIVGFSFALFSGIALLFLVIIVPMLTIQDKQNTNLFKQQKEYIETHEVSSDIENAALTNKKIELNSWLLNAQYAKKNFDIFVFYPDEVLELNPIQ